MIIKGFKICAGNIVAKLAPPAAKYKHKWK